MWKYVYTLSYAHTYQNIAPWISEHVNINSHKHKRIHKSIVAGSFSRVQIRLPKSCTYPVKTQLRIYVHILAREREGHVRLFDANFPKNIWKTKTNTPIHSTWIYQAYSEMFVYVMLISIYINTYMCTYTYMQIYVYLYMYACLCIHIYEYLKCVFTWFPSLYTYIHVHIYTCIQIYIYMKISIHIYVYLYKEVRRVNVMHICKCTYKYIHTETYIYVWTHAHIHIYV